MPKPACYKPPCHTPLTLAAVIVCLLANSLFADDLFEDGVARIFQKHCVSCHNDQQKEGGYSLQSKAMALAEGVIVPGKADESSLLDMITPVDGKAEMPKDGKALKAKEITNITKWINAGAAWPDKFQIHEPEVTDYDWWSYQSVQRPKIPKVESRWVRTPIDAFILRRQKKNGLIHTEEADRRTLIRRVTYDLTGLPPTPAEVQRFVNDPDPLAYERLVDRLLSSKQYGERWARHWLDVVKYADTCGYDKDKLRPNAWPYRDYVIRSFNEDKPYSRFVQEQIAGDVLFPGEPDGILGLGFIAAGPWDFIGHVEVPESKIDGKVARNLDRDDMVSNTLNTFCSVTIQCARCHNHKFDPITQKQYYGLQAVFAAVDRAERPYDTSPEIELKRRELDSQRKKRKTEIAAIEKKMEAEGGKKLRDVRAELTRLKARQTIKKKAEFGYHSQIVKSPDVVKWVEVVLPNATDISRVILHPCHDEFAGIGAGFGFPVRFKVEGTSDENITAKTNWGTIVDRTEKDVTNPGLAAVELNCDLKGIRTVRITATRLAERKNDFILALAELEIFGADGKTVVSTNGTVRSLDSIEAPVRWSRRNLVDGSWAIGANPNLAAQVAELTDQRDKLLATIETPERKARLEELKQAIAGIDKKIAGLPKGKMVYAAATHFKPQGNFKPTAGKPRSVAVLLRGDVTRKGDAVVPGVIPYRKSDRWSFDAGKVESAYRAELAKWLTRKDHPTLWRSIVNRVWQYHFGTGLVATPNDFGRMGAKPSHPELLDWLACEFRDRGQSMKKLHRMIVTSSVYRQSSSHHAANAEIDKSNQFLWRMNRRRLQAEEIRDSILAVSGALNSKMGGPGFYLFQLEKPQHSPHYQYHKHDPADPASHRRSIYRFIVRSQPDPWMTTLDCADSSQSTPKRNETLTSLQALTLLNNRFNLEMAKRFAARLRTEEPTLELQVRRAMLLMTQREPDAIERQELTSYAQQFGLENLCRFLFNLNEFAFLD